MIRRVTQHGARTKDNEELVIITVFEPNINKQAVRKLIPYSKKHQVLIQTGDSYEFK
ncbi:MAG: hypothetical protein ABF649_00665 [Bacillus sp. (in: firmicutes)]